MIYLDSAATTYPKPEKVYTEMDCCMRKYCANPGRGGHKMSVTSGKAVMEARELISSFFNIQNPMQLTFTKNATESLNMAITGILKPGDHVITTSMEHNSVTRPLKTLERNMGIEISIAHGNEFGEIDADDFRKLIRKNTKLIISTLSSNVNGIILPIKEIGKLAFDSGVLFLLDASQGAGSIAVDVEEMNISLLAFPGHKGLMGPQGTGGLYIREGVKITPLIFGGTGSNSESFYQPEDMPDLMESGTLNTPGIVGLRHGIEFIYEQGIENIRLYKHSLTQRLYEGAREIKGVKLYSRNGLNQNSGIVALNFDGVASTEVSYVLDKVYNIAVRAGLHCSPLAHETLGTIKGGIVRLSPGCFNTMDEIDETLMALREIAQSL
ncbi:MAG: aminotransferase class V-fold PLP-dependent enzyme [Bacillota bacterium]